MRRLTPLFLAGMLVAGACRQLSVPEPQATQPGTVRATLVTAVPGRDELVPAAGAVMQLRGTTLKAEADADGRVTLTGITTSKGRLLITLDSDHDGAPERSRAFDLEQIAAGQNRDVSLGTVVLGRNAVLTGKVLRSDRKDFTSGHGGIAVFVPEGPQLAYSGDDGTFSLPGIAEGPVSPSFFASGYAPESLALEARAGEELRVGTIVLFNISGQPVTGTLSGTVQQASGEALADVSVRAASAGRAAVAQTSAEGHFTFDNLATGVWALAFEKSGFTSLRVDNVLVIPGNNSVGPYVMTVGTSTMVELDGGTPPPPDAGQGGGGGGAGGGSGGAGGGSAGGGSAGGGAGGGSGGSGGGSTVDAGFDAGTPPPVAIVGPNQVVLPAATVTLDGMSSTGEQPLVYQWTQTAGPTVTLSQNGTSMAHSPSFTAPAAGSLIRFELTVRDASGRSSSPATATVSVGGRPDAGFLPVGALYLSGQTVQLQSTSVDPYGLALTAWDWRLVSGSPGTLVTDGGAQALLTMPNVAFMAPDQLVGVSLQVTNSIGATSNPFTRTYTARGASPMNWSLDAGTVLTVNVGSPPPTVTLTSAVTSSLSMPQYTTSWACNDPNVVLLGANQPVTQFIAPVVAGPTRQLTCTATATGQAPLDPPMLQATTQVFLVDRIAPSVAQVFSTSHMSPFGSWVRLNEPTSSTADQGFGNCTPVGFGFSYESVGRAVLVMPRDPPALGTLCSDASMSNPWNWQAADFAVPPNSTNVYPFGSSGVLIGADWFGPFESTATFTDPRPVLASLGQMPFDQRELGGFDAGALPYELVAREGNDLVRFTFDPLADAGACSPTCPLPSQTQTFANLGPQTSVEHRVTWSGAELFVTMGAASVGGGSITPPVTLRRSPQGTWSQFTQLTGVPFSENGKFKQVRVQGSAFFVDAWAPGAGAFQTVEAVGPPASDVTQISASGSPFHSVVAFVRGTSDTLEVWSRTTSTPTAYALRSYPTGTGVQRLRALPVSDNPTVMVQASAVPMLSFPGAAGSALINSGSFGNGWDVERRGIMAVAAVVLSGDLRVYAWSSARASGGGGYVAFSGPPRAGQMPPPPQWDNNITCETAWPRVAFVEDALVVTWQERCQPTDPWKVYARVLR